MNKHFILFFAFMVQEPISSGIALFDGIKNGVTHTEGFLLFLLATALDILIGYYFGLFIYTKYNNSKIGNFIKYYAVKTERYRETRVQNIFLFTLATSIFPVSSILAPWLNISLKNAFIYFMFGEILFWYPAVFASVVGATKYTQNLYFGFLFIIISMIIFKFAVKYISDKVVTKK